MYSLTRQELVAIKGEDFVKEFDSLPYVEEESIVDFDYGVPDPKSKTYRGDDGEYLHQDEDDTYHYCYYSKSYDALQKEKRAKKQEENNEITPLGW